MNVTNQSAVVYIDQPGAPDVLKYQLITLPQLQANEVLISQKAIGVNFVDVFYRNGTFPLEAYPAPIGLEAAGIIEAVGEDVTTFNVGDRVAYLSSDGAYAEKRNLNASDLFKLPDAISFDQAAAIMVKGLTAHMLLKDSHKVSSGDVVLIHAMTGGVGSVLSDWAAALGATVIGTVGSGAKKELALSRGFEYVIDLQTENLTEKVKAFTEGKGIDVVYDGTGEATFNQSVALVKDGGTAVLYGWSSGMPVVDATLMEQRKIQFIHPALNNYLKDKDWVQSALTTVFDLLIKGTLKAENPSIYPLSEAAKAHADLESRKTTGSVILHP